MSSLCLRRIRRNFTGNLKANISAITKPSSCSLRLAEFYLCVSQAECDKKETWEVLGNLNLTIGRLENQATGYKVVVIRLKLILKIQNTDLCSLLRIKCCGFYFVSTVPSLCHLYTASQGVCPSLPQRTECYLTSPS